MPPAPPDGFNLSIPWGFLEWILAAIGGVVVSVIAWVWNLGGRIEKLEVVNGSRLEKVVRLESKVDRLESTLAEKLAEAEEARAKLREDLMNELRNLPSRVFIESQIQQLTQRLDGLIDARLPPGRRV